MSKNRCSLVPESMLEIIFNKVCKSLSFLTCIGIADVTGKIDTAEEKSICGKNEPDIEFGRCLSIATLLHLMAWKNGEIG